MVTRRRRSGFRILLALYCGAVFFFLVAPLFVVFPISFSSARYLTFPPPGFSWQWYQSYINDPAWIQNHQQSQ